MDFLKQIRLIQGGMGVYVSNWTLARAVATARPGVTAGTVSWTALDVVHVRLLQLGDPGGHLRRALAAFDARFGVNIGRKIIERYYIEGGKQPRERFKYGPVQNARAEDGRKTFPVPGGQAEPVSLTTTFMSGWPTPNPLKFTVRNGWGSYVVTTTSTGNFHIRT